MSDHESSGRKHRHIARIIAVAAIALLACRKSDLGAANGDDQPAAMEPAP
jgi:hypothetical protein